MPPEPRQLRGGYRGGQRRRGCQSRVHECLDRGGPLRPGVDQRRASCRRSSRRWRRMSGVRTVIVSIGANEMHWARADGTVPRRRPQCDDSASAAWFMQALDSFTVDYYDLLQHLATLPGAPQVIINEYYDPLPAKPACPAQPDVTAAKSAVLLDRLTAFNTVLSEGAASFGFAAVDPSFLGHELCTAQSFVQGLGRRGAAAPERRRRARHRAGRRAAAAESRAAASHRGADAEPLLTRNCRAVVERRRTATSGRRIGRDAHAVHGRWAQPSDRLRSG